MYSINYPIFAVVLKSNRLKSTHRSHKICSLSILRLNISMKLCMICLVYIEYSYNILFAV